MNYWLLIDDIGVGERVRKDLGDISALAESIRRIGLLHPVVVTEDHRLVAGVRRLAALRQLGWREAPVTVVDVGDMLQAERDENEARKSFTPTEAVAIGRLIEEKHRERIAAAVPDKNRRAASVREARRRGEGDQGTCVSNRHLGATREVTARAVGMGAEKYTQAKAVVAAAEDDPNRYGDLAEQMDATGNVSGAHRELERRRAGKGRHPVNYKRAHPKIERIVTSSISVLEGICMGFEGIDVSSVDATRGREWATAISKLARELTRFARRLKG